MQNLLDTGNTPRASRHEICTMLHESPSLQRLCKDVRDIVVTAYAFDSYPFVVDDLADKLVLCHSDSVFCVEDHCHFPGKMPCITLAFALHRVTKSINVFVTQTCLKIQQGICSANISQKPSMFLQLENHFEHLSHMKLGITDGTLQLAKIYQRGGSRKAPWERSLIRLSLGEITSALIPHAESPLISLKELVNSARIRVLIEQSDGISGSRSQGDNNGLVYRPLRPEMRRDIAISLMSFLHWSVNLVHSSGIEDTETIRLVLSEIGGADKKEEFLSLADDAMGILLSWKKKAMQAAAVVQSFKISLLLSECAGRVPIESELNYLKAYCLCTLRHAVHNWTWEGRRYREFQQRGPLVDVVKSVIFVLAVVVTMATQCRPGETRIFKLDNTSVTLRHIEGKWELEISRRKAFKSHTLPTTGPNVVMPTIGNTVADVDLVARAVAWLHLFAMPKVTGRTAPKNIVELIQRDDYLFRYWDVAQLSRRLSQASVM